MVKTSITICMTAAIILAVTGPVSAQCREIWIDQATGNNEASTQGMPIDPFKSITYALAIADSDGWPEPWCVYIRPGVYDADPGKPVTEREIFPIVLGPEMVFEGTDRDTCIIDGQHFTEGHAPLLYGNDLIGLQIRGLTLRNMNHSQGAGGAIELRECAGLLENCTIENCSARSGGGMLLDPHSAPDERFDFSSCMFSGNTATVWSGGGLRITPGPLTGNFTDCTFDDNDTAGRGGGFSVDGNLTGNITGCTITENTEANYAGGGIEINGTLTGDIQGCSFSNNSMINPGYRASRRAGGLYIHGSMNGDITDCNFTGNAVVANWYDVYGGGFCIWNTLNGDVNNCAFVGNSTRGGDLGHRIYGGGFYIATHNGRINGCAFANNTVSSSRDSGGRGAGFAVGTLANGIANCTFLANSAQTYGGGFYVNGNLSGGVSNSSFAENHAGYDGGGFYTGGNVIGDIVDCAFVNNQSDHAGFYVHTVVTGDIRKCEFVNDDRLLGNRAVRINGALRGIMEQCRFFGFPYYDVSLTNTWSEQGPATIRNCLFVDPKEPLGTTTWGLGTNQRAIISNNTMIGPGLDADISPTALYFGFGTQAENSQVYNNIIVQTKKAINVDTMVDMSIQHNLFDDVDCVVVQGESCLGNDIPFLELLLDSFRFNTYEDPGFMGWPTETWTFGATYDSGTGQTTFVDDAAGWAQTS